MGNKILISFKTKNRVLSRDKFKCQKCGFRGMSDELEIHHINRKADEGSNEISNLITLCAICHYYSPDDEKEFEQYLNEKIDGTVLNTFRKSQKSISKRTKKGMNKKAQDGNIISRPALGFKIENKKLLPGNHSYVVQEIYQNFLNQDISLTQLAKKYNLSVNGLKKVLKNYTYLGKVKFDGQIIDGKHQPLLSNTLFNQVQNKLKQKGIS